VNYSMSPLARPNRLPFAAYSRANNARENSSWGTMAKAGFSANDIHVRVCADFKRSHGALSIRSRAGAKLIANPQKLEARGIAHPRPAIRRSIEFWRNAELRLCAAMAVCGRHTGSQATRAQDPAVPLDPDSAQPGPETHRYPSSRGGKIAGPRCIGETGTRQWRARRHGR